MPEFIFVGQGHFPSRLYLLENNFQCQFTLVLELLVTMISLCHAPFVSLAHKLFKELQY